MTTILEYTMYLSVTAVFLLIFKQMFRKKLSAKWQVWVWGILLVRLFVPFLPQSELSVFNAVPAWEQVSEPEKTTPVMAWETAPEPIPDGEVPMLSVSYTAPKEEKISPKVLAKGIYWGGMAALLLYFLTVYGIFCVRVKQAKRIREEKILQLSERCKERLGIRRRVELISFGECPMLTGILRPKIILPEGYSSEETEDIFLHELSHLKHGDLLFIWLSVLILSTQWFNPVLWYSFFVFRRDIEMFCDERVLQYTGNKQAYAKLLLRTAVGKNRFVAGTTALGIGKKELKQRIRYLAQFQKPKKIWGVVMLLAAAVVSVLCLTNSKQDDSMSGERYAQYLGQMPGAIMAELDYADAERVVFHYIDGLFVYDLKAGQIVQSFDLQKLNCAPHQQGSHGLEVRASADGGSALLINYGVAEEIKDFDNYMLDFDSGKARTTRTTELENGFSALQETYTTVPDAVGWFSNTCASDGNRIYYLTVEDASELRNLKLMICDMDGTPLEQRFLFRPEVTAYRGEGFRLMLPTDAVEVGSWYRNMPIRSNVILLDERIWMKPDELDGKAKTVSEGATVTRIYGYGVPVRRMEQNGVISYFIRYPDAGGDMLVLSFAEGAFSDADVAMMLKSLTFEVSELYEQTKAYLQKVFHRAYSPMYEILDLQISGWVQEGDTATFDYTRVDKNYDRDPDTVEYIIKARESGNQEYYETLKREYSEPKEGNFHMKVVSQNGELTIYKGEYLIPDGEQWRQLIFFEEPS